MPYLQVDLDALEEFEVAGALAGTGTPGMALGCLKLWRDCWKQRTEYVAKERLLAFFPGADERKLVTAMTSCGFLEAPPSRPDFRVRGAEKRLGIRKRQQEAGKEHARNLKQFRDEPEASPGLPGTHPEVEPETTRSSKPALTSSIQHPTSSIQEKKKPSSPSGPAALVRVEKPTTERESWQFAEFERWCQYTRQRAGLVPEDALPIFEGEKWWAVATEWTGGAVEPLCVAFIAFGKSPHWEKATPPFPFRAFLSRWKDFMPLKEARHA